jgi:alginate O-acetyltransferase complex protein AlgI
MAFASLEFLAFCLLAVAALRLAPLGWAHQLALALLNLVFVASFAADPLQLVPLAGFALAGYGAVRVSARLGTGAGLGVIVAALVLAFAWLRHYSLIGFVPALPIAYVMVGLPYILMRVLHLMVDVAQGALPVPSLLRYFNYNFSFLTFVSGPIQRYEEHAAQLQARAPMDGARFHDALGRILLGFVMISVFSIFTAKMLGKAEPKFYAAIAAGFTPSALVFYLLTALTYFAHLYFNFVGYMHIVIGVGLLAGFHLPENFNQPLKSESFLDLWARWHMTLGNWFKLYVFNPVMKLLAASDPGPKLIPYLGAVAYFVTFFLLGLWHGSTKSFVVCGFLIGAGVTVNKLWQTSLARRLGRGGYKTLREKAWYALGSRALTLGYFALTLTTLWVNDAHLGLFFSGAGLAVFASGYVAMVLLAAPLIPLCDGFYQLLERAPTSRLFASDAARAAWSALMIFVLLYTVIQMSAGAPDFIYKGF